MIKKVNIKNYENKTLSIELANPSKTGIVIRNIEGLGYPQMSVITSKNIGYNPSDYKGTEIQPRNIIFTFELTDDNIVEQTRRKIYQFFPMQTNIRVTFETDVIGDAYIDAYVENITPSIFEKIESIQVSLICADPYFYTGAKTFFTSGDIHEQVNSTGIIPNFDLSNWFFKKYGGRVNNQVSIVANEEKGIILFVYSKDYHPKGFRIEIRNNTSENKNSSFNRMILKHDNGVLDINPYSDLDDLYSEEYGYLPSSNKYKDSYILVENDIKSQNVFLVDINTGSKTSILGDCVINGDFPNLITGKNTFNALFYGIYKTYSNTVFVRVPSSEILDCELNISEDRMWTISKINYVAMKYRCKVYTTTLETGETYLGTIELQLKELTDCYVDHTMTDKTYISYTGGAFTPITITNQDGSTVELYGQWNMASNRDGGRYGFRVHKIPVVYLEDDFINIPLENIYELEDGNKFAFNFKYLPTNDGTKDINLDGYSLTAKITDYGVSKKKFWQLLYLKYGPAQYQSIEPVDYPFEKPNYYTWVTFKIEPLLEVDNSDNSVDFYDYIEDCNGSINVSFDERYDGI